MFQRLNKMFVGEVSTSSNQEPAFSEKEDDEWILVDFIGGLTTLKVETSPMENLLIEHPSMSVYAVHSSCPGIGEASCGTDECPDPSSPRVESQDEMGQHVHCYVAALAAHTAFLEQPKSFRPSQWIKEHSERQSLNRNSLRRQNLTRDCHSRQVKHNGWAVHQPCPRQYNY
ncbi:tumor protein p53-inducible nuclear protein 1 isoform X2 [Leptonychotes weddellii]|uniref:Tumor protein p53-inducible nuclear protein 1 isoform X2 n=1 Tax=Leptonychotes weddellii TaxID=9713 RepID=A0A7F8QFT2_LEPWE|nr:tumor protein p53-inducible nuclear protein 1 isoform X2 [Leptonychotes weddellii]